MCLALAESRGWTVATDDRKAIRVAAGAGLTVISCPQLVKAWADATRPAEATIAQVLADIETLAQFRPSAVMPESAWWYRTSTCTVRGHPARDELQIRQPPSRMACLDPGEPAARPVEDEDHRRPHGIDAREPERPAHRVVQAARRRGFPAPSSTRGRGSRRDAG